MSDEPKIDAAIERAERRGEILVPALVRAHHCRDGLVRATAADDCKDCKNAFSFFAEPKAVEEFNAKKSRELYDYGQPSANDRRVELFRMTFELGGLVRLTSDGATLNLFAEQTRRGYGLAIDDAVDLTTAEAAAVVAALAAAIDRKKGTPGAR